MFNSMDAISSPAEDSEQLAERVLSTANPAADHTRSAQKRSVSGAVSVDSGEAQVKQRRKTTAGAKALVGAGIAAMALVAMQLVAFPSSGTTINGAPAPSAAAQAPPVPNPSPNANGNTYLCTGGILEPHMISSDLASCMGNLGSICAVSYEYGFKLMGSMICDAGGIYRGAICVDADSGVPEEHVVEWMECHGAAESYYRGRSIHTNHAHFDADSLDACQGTTGSECDYKCDAGYLPYGQMVCDTSNALPLHRVISGDRRRMPELYPEHTVFPVGVSPSTNVGQGKPALLRPRVPFGKFVGGFCRPEPALIASLL